jgi:hypothetical protein
MNTKVMKITRVIKDNNAPGFGLALTLDSADEHIEVRVSENTPELLQGTLSVLASTRPARPDENLDAFVSRVLDKQVLLKRALGRVYIGALSGRQFFVVATKTSEGWNRPAPSVTDEDMRQLNPDEGGKEIIDHEE